MLRLGQRISGKSTSCSFKIGCKLKLSKAHFGFFEVTWVGHKLNGLYLTLDEGRVMVIDRWEIPKTRAALGRFLGFTGYHQHFVPYYAEIAADL